jgi:hypothetical protein
MTAVVALVSICPRVACADIGDVLLFPFKVVGNAIFGGTVDKLKGGLDSSIADVDVRLKAHEDHIAGLAETLIGSTKGKIDDTIDKIDNSLDQRILQIKTGLDDSLDRGLGQVDRMAQARILQVEGAAVHVVDVLDDKARQRLDQIDGILRERSRDIDRMADDLVSHADEAVKARLAQADEMVGRRLGNVDVIASKQRIAVEETGIRLSVLIGVVVFVVYVIQRLWSRYDEAIARGELRENQRTYAKPLRGARRAGRLAKTLTPALGRPIFIGLAGAAVLLGLSAWLPKGAERDAAELAKIHEDGLAASLEHFDYPHARFHASNLEFLKPDLAARYGGLADKAGLLRDIVLRPSLLATRKAVEEFASRVRAVERQLSPVPDADVLVMRAMVAWEMGATRYDEYKAASLAARALRLSPRGFALLPLARAYVETFLDAPYLPEDDGVGRDSASFDELRGALLSAGPDRADTPLAPAVLLARLMRHVQRASSTNYVALVNAHARIVAATNPRSKFILKPEEKIALIEQRTEAANAIVKAWADFDNALQGSDQLQGPIVLNVFRSNDAIFTRALRFWRDDTVDVQLWQDPAMPQLPGKVEEEVRGKDVAARIKLAPARVAWAHRYKDLMKGSPRTVVLKSVAEFAEVERFRSWERWSIEFEAATVAHIEAKAAGQGEEAARWRVVVAAAALGLYVNSGENSTAYALEVAADLKSPPDSVRRTTAAMVSTKDKRGKKETALPVRDAPRTLQEALLARGPQMI